MSHADDLLYLWDPVFNVPHLELAGEVPSFVNTMIFSCPQDLVVSDLMATAWTEFARWRKEIDQGTYFLSKIWNVPFQIF